MLAQADRSQGTVPHGAAVDRPATCHCGGNLPRSVGHSQALLLATERHARPGTKASRCLNSRVSNFSACFVLEALNVAFAFSATGAPYTPSTPSVLYSAFLSP